MPTTSKANNSVAGIPRAHFTSISVSAQQTAPTIESLEQREAETLTQERLDELWHDLVEKSKSDPKFHELIADKEVELKNNNLFHIKVPNLYFDTLLQPYQMTILDHIRSATGNDMISYKVAVVFEKTQKKAYLPNEKFEEMASRNHAMYTLRQLFPVIDF